MSSNCLIIAGEKSGEEHCLSFFTSLKSACPDIQFWGVGGDELQAQGMELIYHLKDFSSWGFSEVIGKIPFYFKALRNLEEMVVQRNCKVAILIDFQDFNLRLAKKLKKRGVKVLYYVAPQAWAWKAWRAKVLEMCVHTLFTIIPFEKEWFEKRGVRRVKSVPHPVWLTNQEKLREIKKKTFKEIQNKIRILLLPGSRNFEVKYLLPEFIEAVDNLKKEIDIELSIVCSSNVDKTLYDPYYKKFNNVYDNTQLSQALLNADFCFASSGTVTLNCALYEIPTVVCYKASLFNEFIFYTFVNYKKFISLANIVHQKSLFPELIQEHCTDYNIEKCFRFWFDSEKEYNKIIEELRLTKSLLGQEKLDVSSYMKDVLIEVYKK